MISIIYQILELKVVKISLSILIMSFSFLIGSFDVTMKAMICAIVMDFILGFGYAVYHGMFCKQKFRRGLEKEMIFCCALILGHLADLIVFHQEVEFGIKNLIIVYIGINEVISGLRHLGQMGWTGAQRIIARIEGIPESIFIKK